MKSQSTESQPIEKLDKKSALKLLAEQNEDDPIAIFLMTNWRTILTCIGAVGVAWYMYKGFVDSRMASLQNAADTFYSVRQQYKEIVQSGVESRATSVQLEEAREKLKSLAIKSKDAKNISKEVEAESKAVQDLEEKLKSANAKLDEKRAKMDQSLTALGDFRDPYKSLSQIYKGLLLTNEGKFEEAAKRLEEFNWSDSQNTSNEGEQFLKEAAGLLRAKILVEQDDKKGRAALLELAEKARYVDVPALVTLSQISEGQQRPEIDALVESKKKSFPEVANLLEKQLSE